MREILVAVFTMWWSAPFWAPLVMAGYAFGRRRFTVKMFLVFVTVEAIACALHMIGPEWRAMMAI
jgi:hypothetical protein